MRLPASATLATLGEQLEAALEEAIITGVLAPGQRINPDEVAEQFGVSRIPVREALRSLDANGWVTIRPRHGAYVRERTERELRQLFEVREVLDTTAARLAAQRRTADQLAGIVAAAERCLHAAEQGGAGVAALNTAFHLAVCRASGNDELAAILERVGKRVHWYYTAVAPVRGLGSAREHLDLVDAIRRQDPDAAAAAMGHHVRGTLDVLDAALAERGQRLA